MNWIREYRSILQSTSLLLEEEPLILASPEETLFFRQTLVKKKEVEPKVELKPTIKKFSQTPPFQPTAIIEPKATASEKPTEIQVDYNKITFSFHSLAAIVSKVAPEMTLIKEIPSDLTAQQIAKRWKTKNQTAPITILQFCEPEPHQKLLQEITKAIDIYFGPCKIVQAESIEKEKQWEFFLSSENLKLIIVCDYTLWQLNELMQFYKEVPAQGTRTLGKVPLFLLPDLSLYLKDSLLKRSLWKALCQKIS